MMMKNLILSLAVLLGTCRANAQQNGPLKADTVRSATLLELSTNKTSLLIFPASVRAADRGDSYVMAEKVKGVENMLKVKAGQQNFAPSNLHVITSDGNVYDFTVVYSDTPQNQTIDLRSTAPFGVAVFKGVSLNSTQLSAYGEKVSASDPFVKGVHERHYRLLFTLEGLFIKDDVLFVRYRLKNFSHIPYDEGSLRFFVRDRKKAKRTSEQDNELQALQVTRQGSPESDRGQVIIAAFARFTIADSKRLVTELMERGGDRNLSLKLSGEKLLQARPLR
ncbi:Bacteroides conjugative transposon TraN protein [Pedobacter suwonensis]|uniref:Bacteroides conjugative transposon TraN protein n=1 Tax=Pedobacter suwonensis TaxID=332999 RepID=A0A1I0TXB8_9SPHI|nr:conjugative transposon protein TraN [Pedobacter suwonensis]SFA56471.1 Bacteroides conjugative transposon TraN protein [Pedobacter suwonensis]